MAREKTAKAEPKSLKERILATSTIGLTSSLEKSSIFGQSELYTTPVPMINTACSGSIDGGFGSGVHTLAAPSKHFKSLFALLMAKSFLKKKPHGLVIFSDSEFGSPGAYFHSFKIPLESVIHIPITDIEELKHEFMVQLKELKRIDDVLIIIDSIGNLASRKEVEDAISGKSVVDMTRAKALKSLFRMITPHLTLKNIPLWVVNHTYQTQEMYSKTVVSGGTGPEYSSDSIWTIGRQQDKDGDDLTGYHFIIKVVKSRHVKEGSKFPITVAFEGGIRRWSGMLDLAVEAKYIIKPAKGKYALPSDPETTWSEAQIENNNEFWKDLFLKTDFAAWIKNKYTLEEGAIINSEDYEEYDDEPTE